MIVPFVSFSVDVLVRFVSVMYCAVQNNKMSRLIHIVGFFYFVIFNSAIFDVVAVPMFATARR